MPPAIASLALHTRCATFLAACRQNVHTATMLPNFRVCRPRRGLLTAGSSSLAPMGFHHIVSSTSYTLLDCGGGARLEQAGGRRLIRSCPSATWPRGLPNSEWRADLTFDAETGWHGPLAEASTSDAADDWLFDGAGFSLALSAGAHGQIGAFPEQQQNWRWLRAACQSACDSARDSDEGGEEGRAHSGTPAGAQAAACTYSLTGSHADSLTEAELAGQGRNPSARTSTAGQSPSRARPLRVLNLFGYTGGSTLACAAGGAEVVHVDGARAAVKRAQRNAQLSGLEHARVRYLTEDVMTYVQRAARRGDTFDGVVLDPPAFGRGGNRKDWRIERDLPSLLAAVVGLLSADAAFILLTAHGPRWPVERLEEALRDALETRRDSHANYAPNSLLTSGRNEQTADGTGGLAVGLGSGGKGGGRAFAGTIESGDVSLIAATTEGRDLPMGSVVRWSTL